MHEHLEHLIWTLNPQALREQPLVDRRLWSGSVQHELVTYNLDPPATQPKVAASAVYDVAVVMMIKDEADIIGENLRWLYFVGLRRYVISDNLSSDATRDILRDFRRDHPQAEVMIVTDPLVRYLQAEKTTGLFRLAISIWPDLHWVVPIDADEFLIPQRGLELLRGVPDDVDAITIPKVIHFRHRIDANPGESVLLRMACRSPFFCVPPKIILRTRLDLTISQGNHKVIALGDRTPRYDGGFGYGIYYREFPTRSFEQFLRKVRNGGAAILAAQRHFGRGVGGEHWLKYHELLVTKGEISLFEVFEKDWVKTSLPPGWSMDPFGAISNG
jgi:hypothetical protein